MEKVTISFVGHQPDEVAKKFYHWIVDGGLEDSIIDTLSDDEVKVDGIKDFNNETLSITIESSN